ncbi:hypothetical protein LJK88_50030 [Paenibacillus sp. P26]|nr:hypothetical protein LJK88_50030 [Paenibacillus sp. P26]
MALEIERKFLLHAYPEVLIRSGELVVRSEQYIEQTYLAIDGKQERGSGRSRIWPPVLSNTRIRSRTAAG